MVESARTSAHVDNKELEVDHTLDSPCEKEDEEQDVIPIPHTNEPVALSSPEYIPPNGGYGWVCVVAVFFINAHTWGMNSSYGIFLAHYLSTDTFPGATRTDYAFIGGLSISQALFISPIATMTIRYWGTRTALIIGVALETLSFIGASFSNRIWQLSLSQGVCFGWGCGFLFVASVGVIPQWFTTRRSFANGIGAAGSGFGGLVYSLATNAMLQRIGLPWAFRVLGILSFVVNLVCTIVVRDRNKQIGSSFLAFDVRLFKRPEFWLLLGYGAFSMLGYVVLLYSIPNYARVVGLTAKQASVVGAVLNLGQGLGRPPIGYFSDAVGRINMAGSMTLLCAVLILVVWIFAKTYGVLIFYALVGGTVAGTFWATVGPVTAEVVGLKELPAALSITWVVLTLPTTFSEPIGLQIVSKNNGHYLGAQLFTGVMYLAATLCLWFLKAWKVGQLERIAAGQDGNSGIVDPVQASDLGTSQQNGRGNMSPLISRLFRWKKV